MAFRVGGGNRGAGLGEEALYADPNYITTFDDSFDSTFATYVFKVPDRWKTDFTAMRDHGVSAVSDAYFAEMCRVYPKLVDKFKELREKPVNKIPAPPKEK